MLSQWWSEQPWHSPVKVPSFLLTREWNLTSKSIKITFSLAHCCPSHRSTSKTFLVFSAGLRTIRWGQKVQEWLSENVPHFIPKEEWSLYEYPWFWNLTLSKVWATHHQNLEALKVKLQNEWAKVTQKVIRDTCKDFPKRFQLVIDADGGHIFYLQTFHCFLYNNTFSKVLNFV